MITVTISIGRNVDGVPLSDARWNAFKQDIFDAVTHWCHEIHVNGAVSVNSWNGIAEESCTFVADSRDFFTVGALHTRLELACKNFDQDAIALTVGTTDLVTGR